ncbi:MAG: hypothetical protein Ct9H300mP10_06020 [Methanobacteriota archaeon]|nr:MAG: hypothetical protein Ct9H300mP10_06020 [Euryarchaeota archaeon]
MVALTREPQRVAEAIEVAGGRSFKLRIGGSRRPFAVKIRENGPLNWIESYFSATIIYK